MRAIWRSRSWRTARASGRSIPGVVGDLVVGEEGRVDRRGGRRGRRRSPSPPGGRAGPPSPRRASARRCGCGRSAAARRRGPGPRAARRSRPMSASDEDEGAGDRVGTREVGAVVAPERAPAAERGAHRQHRVRRVAGEDVGAAGAVGVEQPAAVGVAPLELFGVARVVGDDRPSRAPSPTSGRPACRRLSRAGCPPGRRRSARTSRSPSGCRRWLPGAQPARPGSARCRRGSPAAGRRGRGRRSPAGAGRGPRSR